MQRREKIRGGGEEHRLANMLFWVWLFRLIKSLRVGAQLILSTSLLYVHQIVCFDASAGQTYIWFHLVIPYPWFTSKPHTVYPLDTHEAECHKTKIMKKEQKCVIFFWKSFFSFPMDFHRVEREGCGCLAPRYHSNPDMSAAIKPCAFQLFKDKPWFQR